MASGLMTVAPRRRSPKIRAVELWRRGGPARGRGRARTRDQAHHRADGGVGAVGLGHADQRSALRGQPHPLRRRRAHFGRRGARRCSAELEQQAAGRLRAWFDGPIGIERSAEMRYGEQIFEIDVPLDDHRLGCGLDWSTRSKTGSIAGTRNSTPMPRAARRWCSSTRASPRSAKSRDGIRTRSRHPRRPPVHRAARGRRYLRRLARSSASTHSTISGRATLW